MGEGADPEYPYELVVWEMAERFGWTLEYIENLPLKRLSEYLQIQDGRTKAINKLRKK